MAEVEREINAMWGISTTRSLMRRAIVYSIGFIAVPALIGAAVYVTKWGIERSMRIVPVAASEAVTWLLRRSRWGSAWRCSRCIYALVPARRPVRWKPALAGGMLAAVAFDVAKTGFAFYIKLAPTYQIVYGALAALPLFLIWVYVSWLIVLAGAAIAATLAEMSSTPVIPG